MPAASIAGSAFTVTFNAAAYTDQVTSGTVTITPTITRTKTLGGNAYSQTDLIGSIELEFLYDDNTGMYTTLETASGSGSSVAVVVDGGTNLWTMAAGYIEELSMEVTADGVATCAVTFTGTISYPS